MRCPPLGGTKPLRDVRRRARISLSVPTVEFAQAAGSTALTWTEQGAYFDGFDGSRHRSRAYLALASGAESGLTDTIRLPVLLAGPASVTLINVWACGRIWRDHGELLFLDGAPDASRPRPVTGQGIDGPSRRGFLRMAVPPAIVIATPL
jgi:hypothetical protein